MASSARLVTIKRSGDDGAHFPLSLSSCLFGRSIECDIRIQLPVVSKKHCKIEVKEQEAILYNFSSANPTQVNGTIINEPVQLKHGDIITIIDRSFRYEDGSHDGSRPTEFPRKSLGKEPARRASRDTISADPDGKDQDTKASKMTASRRSFVYAKGLSADSPASDDSKDSVTQDSSGHVEQHDRRNLGEPTSGDLFKKFRATRSSYGDLKSSPAQSLSNSNKNESPFEKLYQSMKEELDVKSEKSHRKSEPQFDRAAEESWETERLVSCKARPKSSRSTPVTATSSPKVGKSWTERWRGGVGPVQTPTETAKMKTPVQKAQQLKDEDSRVPGRRNSVNLDESESAQAVHKIVTPGKLVTRNQAAVKVGHVASPANTPEHSSSKKRRSIPADMEVPCAETQKRLSLTQCLAPGEKKSPKDSFSKPEKLGTVAKQTCSGITGLSSIDISNCGDSINKSEGVPLKRRRVSFGGHLRPELFDENLPPNTPLKRGETPTKRKSLGTHSPAGLKKIIKERPPSPGKQESPGVTPPRTNDERRRSGRTSLASSGSKFLYETDIPKKAGRKSGNLPAKRASISRSQHGILQMICSKRRSGASEANLIVAKSWADVVKLGVKQTQMKVVKHVPQKQTRKRQRRPSTPKKPTSSLHDQFTTGHANSPCTIVIGRAQTEKASMPARPYKMLNNLMLNWKMDFSEDLSGLTEMFKTPVKEKQQQMSDVGSILSDSENLSERQLQGTNSEDTPPPTASEILGEKVLLSTQNAAKQQSNKYSASSTLRRQSIKHENTVQTPKNVHNITQIEKKTPASETEPLKTASSMSKLRRSRELRHTLVKSKNEKTEAVLAKSITGRHLRKTFQGQEVDQQVQGSENSSQRCEENSKLSEDSEKTSARRSSARKQKLTKDLVGSQMVTQSADCAEDLLSQEQGTIQNLEESMYTQNTSKSDQGVAKQKVNTVVDATRVKRWSKTPVKMTHPLEGAADFTEHFETPDLKDEPIGDDETKVLCKSPQPKTENLKASAKPRTSTSRRKVDRKEELSAVTKLIHMSGESRHTPKVLKLEHGDIKALRQSENEMLAATVTGSKRPLEKAKEKAQPVEDLTGFEELFLSPVPGDKITKMPSKSPHTESVRTPASTKRLSTTGLSKVDVREEPATLGKRTKSSGRVTGTPAPAQEDNDTTTFMETPKQKLDFTGNSTGHKRRSQASKNRAQPLEDLDGFQELFQTPAAARTPVTVDESAKVSLESVQPQLVITSASTKRLSKTGLSKVDVREEPSTLGKRTKSSDTVTGTPAPVQDENNTTAFMQTPKQKLDFTGNSTGHKRRSRASKNRAQPLEDLDGFQELFQTPAAASDPVTVDESAKVSLESVQPQLVITPASTKRLSKTGLSKVDVREEPSTLGKRTKSSGRVTGTPAPVQEENNTTTFMETPKQKLESLGDLTGLRKQSRTPKAKAQYLEDISGFQEGFQTPDHANGPLAVGKTKKMSFISPQPGSAITLKSIERQSRASMSNMNVKEELLESEEHLQLGEGIDTLQVPNNNKVFRSSRKPAKRKLDPTASMPSSKRMRRSSKDSTPSLEDVTGSQQLCQMPGHAKDSLNTEASTMFTKPPQSGPVRTQNNRKSLPKISLRQVDVTGGISVLGKQSPGRALTAPVQADNGIKAIMETPKETLATAADLTGFTRPQQTPKEKDQPLEDYGGFQELFQTPAGASDSVTVEESKKMPVESLQPQPVRTPASTKRLSKTGLSKVDVREEPSTPGKRTKSSDTVTGTPAPVPEENDTTPFMQTPKQKLEFTGNSAGHKRRSRTPKTRAQPLEDLDGFQELFQTPAGASDPVTVDESTKVSLESSQPLPVITPASTKRLSKTPGQNKDLVTLDNLAKMPGSSPPPEPIDTSVISGRQLRTRLRNLYVKNELSEDGMHPKMSGEIVDSSRAPGGEEKVIKARKQCVKRKLDTAVNLPSSKRQRIAGAEEPQTLEDLPGFQELCQAPCLVMDSVIVDKTTKVPSKSPEPVDTTSEIKPRRRLKRLGVTEEPIPQRTTTRVLRQTRNTHKEPIDSSNGVDEFKESSAQKQDPAISLTGRRNQPRKVKEKTQPLEELTSFQEEIATRMSCKSPQPEEKKTLVGLKKQLRIQLFKVGVEEEPTAQRKQPARETRSRLKEPMGNRINVEELKKSTEQKIDPVASMTVSKRPRRIPKEKAQTVELAGLKGPIQTLGHTEESARDKEPTQMPCNSLQPEQVDSLQPSPRRPRTRHGKVEADKPSAVRKTVPTSRQSVRSRKVTEIDDNGTKASKAPVKQTLDTVAKETDSKRQLRTRKNGVQPLEVLGDSKEITQISDHSEKLRHDTNILKSTLQQKPDSMKPLRKCRRVLRTSKEDPKEVLMDTSDLAALQSKSNLYLSPPRKSARDGRILKTRTLCSVTPKQEATGEKPVHKKQRAASTKRQVSPEPVKVKHLRSVSHKRESVEEHISTIMQIEEMEAKRENPVTPDQKIPQSSRYRKKTEKQPSPKFDASAEKVGIKKNEKTMKISQETEPQNPDPGTKKSSSLGKVSGKRTCLRSRGQTEIPQPHEAEEKTRKSGAEISIKTQQEKGVSGDPDVRRLRSRQTRVTLDNEPKPRVTRGAKKDAKTLKKDEDIVYTKILRTRSHQKSETV